MPSVTTELYQLGLTGFKKAEKSILQDLRISWNSHTSDCQPKDPVLPSTHTNTSYKFFSCFNETVNKIDADIFLNFKKN